MKAEGLELGLEHPLFSENGNSSNEAGQGLCADHVPAWRVAMRREAPPGSRRAGPRGTVHLRRDSKSLRAALLELCGKPSASPRGVSQEPAPPGDCSQPPAHSLSGHERDLVCTEESVSSLPITATWGLGCRWVLYRTRNN